MGETTGIAWTDHSWSPWHGCAHAILPDGTEHPGCGRCYAEAMSRRNPAVLGEWGPGGTRILTAANSWKGVLGWEKRAAKAGVMETVFPSVCDPFEDWQGRVNDHHGLPLWTNESIGVFEADDGAEGFAFRRHWTTLPEVREKFFRLIDDTPHLRWLLLTKRPQNVRQMWPDKADRQPIFPGMPGPLGDPMPCVVKVARRENVHILTSVSDQKTADAMVPELLKCRDLSPVLGVSLEPMLGPVDWDSIWPGGMPCPGQGPYVAGIDVVIIGVESNGSQLGRLSIDGTATESDWLRNAVNVVRQCKSAGVSVWVKQIPLGGRLVKDIANFPPELQFQEWPQ